MLLFVIKSALSAFFACLCYSFIFNVKGKNIWIAGLIGAIGGLCYKMIIYFDGSELFANFIGVIALSFLSEIFARKCKTPVTTFRDFLNSFSSGCWYVSNNVTCDSW